ncbi:MAG: hypothetical protein ACYDEP_06100 [Acidimicrobiales bacterium]
MTQTAAGNPKEPEDATEGTLFGCVIGLRRPNAARRDGANAGPGRK